MKRNPKPKNGPDNELTRLAVDLDLTALPEALPDLLERAEGDGLSYTDFAIALLRTEYSVRQERKLSRGLKRSHLGTIEGIDGFDFAARPQLEPRVVKELLNCRFIEERRNLIFVGKPGLGKTRIAKTIAHAACVRGHSVLFANTMQMLEDIHASLADRSFKRVFSRYTKPALLVADELGYEGLDSRHANYLYRLVSARHGQGAIIVTANVGFSRWSSFFPSDSQAVPTVDRLLDRATILRFTGKSFRQPGEIHGAPLEE
ncbi:MAG: ATPase [Acidobacteria bacterium]|jgi:DNA replication protein DnaC|nr:ATPase [Acidobacteriota bacterium]